MLGSPDTTLSRGQDRDCGRPATHAAISLNGLDAPQSAARHLIRRTLAGRVDDEYTDDVILVADELVGNALTHTGAALDLCLDVYVWGVAVQVRDRGEDTTAVPETPLAADMDDEGGRGLFLVDALTSAWGVQRDSTGKRVVALFLRR